MKVARDLDAEARATFTDDKAVRLGRVAPAAGESPATTEQVPVLLLEPRTAMMIANPKTGEVTEGQVEAIIKAGLQRLTWPAALVQPREAGRCNAPPTGSSCATPMAVRGWPCVLLEPRWVSAAVSWGQVLVLYGVRLGVRVPPDQGNRRYGPPSGERNPHCLAECPDFLRASKCMFLTFGRFCARAGPGDDLWP
jgi:hypothetical protein